MRSTLIISGLAAASLTLAATADITSVGLVSYSVTAEEFGGASVTVNVQDLYLYSDNAADVALNVYDLTLAEAARVTYYQSATGAGWAPTNLGGMFDTSATRLADSFVTIGGFMQDMLIPEQAPGMGAGTGLDPNFGGNGSPYPNAFAGWYNGSPPNLNGQVGMLPGTAGMGVLVGRFAYDGDFDLAGSTLSVTWNEGIGTGAEQATFTVVPAPGAFALLGLAGLAGRRRRTG
jgi:MYXO-CTERM domain-containing protein